MSRDNRDLVTGSSSALKRCVYQEWNTDFRRELDLFVQQLTEGQRRVRQLGKEIDAALEKPSREANLSN